MERTRAGRNRTLTLLPGEAEAYLGQCMELTRAAALEDVANRVIHGDAFLALAHIPPACVDLLVVDPPYNLRKAYGATSFKKMDEQAYRAFTEKWIAAVKPALKKSASVYVCCDWKSSLIIGEALQRAFTLRNRITWQREKGRGAKANWKNAMEDIWFATCSGAYTFHADAVKMRRRVLAPYRSNGAPKDWEETGEGNFRDTYPSNFWDDLSVPYWSMPENTDHPAQKPEKLLAKLLLASSGKGDVVLDPFAGVGTTAVVAKKLGRRYIVIEREKEYCALAQKRLALAEQSPGIQGYADGVFWERNTFRYQK